MEALSDGELTRLLARTARGDAVAFRAFYEATVARCYGLALSLLFAPAAAEDCVSEVYAQVWRSAAAYDVEKGTPVAWLLMICRTRAIDQLRREQARRKALPEADAGDGALELAIDGEDAFGAWLGSKPLRGALARLGSAERRLVSLAFVHDLSHAEIAQSTGLPLGTVKSRLRRALQLLRQELDPDEAPA
jgi:RNA polymerase sigma-70 factor, ECF subfamily